MTIETVDCGHPGDQLLSVEAAQRALLDAVSTITDVHQTALDEALGRVLATDVASLIDVPGFDNSAMDGYAVALQADAVAPWRFEVTQRIPAGRVGTVLEPGCAARIFTGAPIPPGTDAVVMQENVRVIGGYIEIERPIRAGDNIRRRGNAISHNATVLTAGQRLAPQHVALAASVGLASLPVYQPLRVGVFFTGDELVQPGAALGPGQIYNANRYAITALLANLGCTVRDLGTVADTLEATCDALERLAADCDLVMTTGGVSVGEEDHVKPAVERLGQLSLWRIAMKPGKPLAFGEVGTTPFVGLPGNPVSAFVTFLLFARPLLLKMQGVREVQPRILRVRAGFDWPRGRPRREFVRVRIDSTATEPVASQFPRQGSDVLDSIAWADGLVEIREQHRFSAGEWLNFIPFCGLLA